MKKFVISPTPKAGLHRPFRASISSWGFHMSYVKALTCTLFVAAMAAGCTTTFKTDLPTRGRVFLLHDSHLEPAPNILVLASRIDVCDRGFMGGGSTTGIDAYVVRTDSNGAFKIPSKTYSHACSRVVLLSNGFLPGYRSQSGRVRLFYQPEEAKRGITENDAILIPSQVTESRGKELAGSLYSLFSSYTVNTIMSKQIYFEMLPEIEKLSQKTDKWNEECYRIGAIARLVDQEINSITCKHYKYQNVRGRKKSGTAQPQQASPGDAPKATRP